MNFTSAHFSGHVFIFVSDFNGVSFTFDTCLFLFLFLFGVFYLLLFNKTGVYTNLFISSPDCIVVYNYAFKLEIGMF